jgi:hypothetical protein
MEYLATKYTITVGGLRVRFVLALEDADDESADRQIRTVPDTPHRERTSLTI